MTDQRGLSLIELLVFIVVVGIAVTGVLSVYSLNARTSVDPMIRKQAVAIAESLLEEVLAKPYTYCDPDDPNVSTATSAAGCTVNETAMGPEAGETRYSNLTPYDNVNDYNGFNMPAPPGIIDLTGNPVTGLAGYSALVQVQPAGTFTGIPAGETLRVTVTVTAPGNLGVTLSGHRTRYAPNL
ncbi:MAG: type IV pilus modification PilV family protein [Thiobacillus sp.]